jgi:hypothetical protein
VGPILSPWRPGQLIPRGETHPRSVAPVCLNGHSLVVLCLSRSGARIDFATTGTDLVAADMRPNTVPGQRWSTNDNSESPGAL